MKLTLWTDYALRVLMYCAACEGRALPPTVGEIAEAHGISRSHLTKIVMTLASTGWLETVRGRGGGLRLLIAADQLTVGDVVRVTEPDMHVVECFDPATTCCRIAGGCRLQGALRRATGRFLEELDGVTLADLVAHSPAGREMVVLGPRPVSASAVA